MEHYSVPGTVPGSGDTTVNKTEFSAFKALTSKLGDMQNKISKLDGDQCDGDNRT